MDIVQIVSFGIIASLLSITIKKQSPEFAILISIAASILIIIMILPKVSAVFLVLDTLSKSIDTNEQYISVVLKIVGISYITEFGSQICTDSGESSIASKIELAGKILIMVVSTPIILSLLNLITNILP